MKYRKKPVEIEAFCYDGDLSNRAGNFYVPAWAVKAFKSSILICACVQGDNVLVIKTLEGEMQAHVGDYIIQGVKGELYPCNPDIFKLTYEEVQP